MNEYILVAAKNQYTSHSLVGFLRLDSSGKWEGQLGAERLYDVVFGETTLSFSSHELGVPSKKNSLCKVAENIYRQARFGVYVSDSGRLSWSSDLGNKTIVLIPVEVGFTQRLFKDLTAEGQPSAKGQTYDVPW